MRFIPLLLCLLFQNKPTDGCDIKRDVVYGRVGDVELKCDVWTPKPRPEGKLPAIVYIHGGGWSSGDKYHPKDIGPVVRAGFIVVSVNYRLSGVAPWPAQIEDCKLAVRWVRAHAEKYGVDADHLGAWGGSAGGHLALMVGCAEGFEGKDDDGTSSRVQAVCSWYGVAEFLSDGGAVAKLFGGSLAEKPEMYKMAGPINHVSADDPPVLMVHGEQDPTVPIAQSEKMLGALKKAGVSAELLRVKNAGHVFKQVGKDAIEPSFDDIEKKVIEFFGTALGKR